MAKLKLLADIYDQLQADDDPRGLRSTKRITKGEIFETVNDGEAERLKEIGAALDPKEAAEKARQEAEEKAQALRDQAAALEAEADATATVEPDSNDVEGLTGPEINKRLKALDLPVSGNVGARRARLSEALAAEPQE